MTSSKVSIPTYKILREWLKYYARPEAEDRRMIQEYMEIETAEKIRGIRAELIALKNAQYKEKSMKDFLGPRRLLKHKTPEDWAKSMLLWMADKKR